MYSKHILFEGKTWLIFILIISNFEFGTSASYFVQRLCSVEE